jgi:hypothetical protein
MLRSVQYPEDTGDRLHGFMIFNAHTTRFAQTGIRFI